METFDVDRQVKAFDTAAGFFRYSSVRDGEKSRIPFTNPLHKGRTEGRACNLGLFGAIRPL